MNRIAITGSTGSGKTTLAEKAAKEMNAHFFDLDEFHWLPGWQERDKGEFKKLVLDAVAKESWVMSGNYKEVRPHIWERADTVVWLDYPFYLVFWRLLNRSIARIRDRRSICNGNYETWHKFFSTDSIMVWLFKSYWKRKKVMREALENKAAYPHITFVHLTTPEETEIWLQQLSSRP